jgi:hypothetical protein
MSTSLHLFLRISQAFFSYAVLLLSSHGNQGYIPQRASHFAENSIVLFWKDPSVHDLSIQANFLSLLSGIVIIVFCIEFALSSPLKGITLFSLL